MLKQNKRDYSLNTTNIVQIYYIINIFTSYYFLVILYWLYILIRVSSQEPIIGILIQIYPHI